MKLSEDFHTVFFKSKLDFNKYKGEPGEAEEGGLFSVIPNGHSCVVSHSNVLDALKRFELKCRGNMNTH